MFDDPSLGCLGENLRTVCQRNVFSLLLAPSFTTLNDPK